MRRNIISDEATEQRAGVHPTRETDGLSAFRLASEWTSGGIGYVSLMTSAHASFPRIQPEAAEGSTMNELDLVVLTHPIATHGLEPRDVGTLVHVYQNGQAYEVEFVTAEGAYIAVLTLTAADVRPRALARSCTFVRWPPLPDYSLEIAV